MKFFVIILLSSFHVWSSVYHDGAQDIPEPSHQLYFQCSKLQNLLPRNDDPNIFYPILEILAEEDEKNDLSTSLPKHLYSMTEDILYAYGCDPCSQHPSLYEHSHYCIFEPEYHDTEVGHLPAKHDNGISLPKLYDNINGLWYGSSFYSQPYNKAKIFIETKVTAMELQGFNL